MWRPHTHKNCDEMGNGYIDLSNASLTSERLGISFHYHKLTEPVVRTKIVILLIAFDIVLLALTSPAMNKNEVNRMKGN